MVFGQLTALSHVGVAASRDSIWSCDCVCGGRVNVKLGNLTSGNTQSCGCSRGRAMSKDISGIRSGRLVAIEPTEGRYRGCVLWLCRCDCGMTKALPGPKLVSKDVISCGCEARSRLGLRPDRIRDQKAVLQTRRYVRQRNTPGSHTLEQIEALVISQKGRCNACLSVFGRAFHRDHIRALSRGGSNDIDNIQLLCISCNVRKGSMDWSEFLAKVAA
jgi:hypothetical protein